MFIREFAKLYPNEDPHDLFEPLVPTGFDVEESKKGWVEILCKNGLSNTVSNTATMISDYFSESLFAKKFSKWFIIRLWVEVLFQLLNCSNFSKG